MHQQEQKSSPKQLAPGKTFSQILMKLKLIFRWNRMTVLRQVFAFFNVWMPSIICSFATGVTSIGYRSTQTWTCWMIHFTISRLCTECRLLKLRPGGAKTIRTPDMLDGVLHSTAPCQTWKTLRLSARLRHCTLSSPTMGSIGSNVWEPGLGAGKDWKAFVRRELRSSKIGKHWLERELAVFCRTSVSDWKAWGFLKGEPVVLVPTFGNQQLLLLQHSWTSTTSEVPRKVNICFIQLSALMDVHKKFHLHDSFCDTAVVRGETQIWPGICGLSGILFRFCLLVVSCGLARSVSCWVFNAVDLLVPISEPSLRAISAIPEEKKAKEKFSVVRLCENIVVLVAQLVSRHSCVADRLPVVVRFPAGPQVRLKTVDPPKGNGLGQSENILRNWCLGLDANQPFFLFLLTGAYAFRQVAVYWDLLVYHVTIAASYPGRIDPRLAVYARSWDGHYTTTRRDRLPRCQSAPALRHPGRTSLPGGFQFQQQIVFLSSLSLWWKIFCFLVGTFGSFLDTASPS